MKKFLTAVLLVVLLASTSFVPPVPALVYAKCVGGSPCKACSNCKYCNYCNSGGSCGSCAKEPPKKPTQQRALQCQAITKKGTQCSRNAQAGSKYCWQHNR